MRRLIYFGTAAACALALSAVPAAAHNAGCVQTGNDERWVFVGSNKSAPYVPEQNPHYHTATAADRGRLDLLEGRGDQYGVRFAAEQHADVGPQPPLPTQCTAPPPRGQ